MWTYPRRDFLMAPLTAQVDLSSMEIVGLIRYTQRILIRRHPNEFSKLSMFWKAEDMPLNCCSGSIYQKRLRDGVMIASRRECGIGTDRGKKTEDTPFIWPNNYLFWPETSKIKPNSLRHKSYLQRLAVSRHCNGF